MRKKQAGRHYIAMAASKSDLARLQLIKEATGEESTTAILRRLLHGCQVSLTPPTLEGGQK